MQFIGGASVVVGARAFRRSMVAWACATSARHWARNAGGETVSAVEEPGVATAFSWTKPPGFLMMVNVLVKCFIFYRLSQNLGRLNGLTENPLCLRLL